MPQFERLRFENTSLLEQYIKERIKKKKLVDEQENFLKRLFSKEE